MPPNLPTVVRPLIGRDEQLDSLAALLDGARLLSLDRARRCREDFPRARRRRVGRADAFPDGAFGVRLASVDDR